MAKEQPKVHIISDPSLGGIQREYVEVDRKANVGDYVIVHGKHVEKVVGHINLHISGIELAEYWVGEGEYRTLAPTDIVQIDGERFRMVERKAVVGERVVVVNKDFGNYENGDICTVVGRYDMSQTDAKAVGVDTAETDSRIRDYEYRVLIPVEAEANEPTTVDQTQASPQVIDMLANLAQRIVALENELADLKSRESVNSLARDLAEFIAKEARKNGRG